MKSEARRALVAISVAVGLGAIALAVIHKSAYGLTLFVVLPMALGAVAGWGMDADSAANAMGFGAMATLIASLGFFAMGAEGMVCIVLAAPLAMPLGAVGGLIGYQLGKQKTAASGVAMLLLLPLGVGTTGFDLTAKPHVFVVMSSIEIAAPPETVWKNVVSFSELPPPTEWYFKTGLAYPIRAHIDGSGPGATRYCEFSTGPLVEPIEVWDEPHLLRFSVAQNPAPMEEWSPYAKVLSPHLHGHLISKQGQFLLTALPNRHTLLEGTTWYQHGLWPEMYWTIWSQAIIHRIHMRVLVHIKDLSEQEESR
jgi:hypothetical protein